MNPTTRRYPRTLAEAWPQHYAWRSVLTRHRAPLLARLWPQLVRLTLAGLTLAMFAALGVLLAWRG
jgi:hypothetical protein